MAAWVAVVAIGAIGFGVGGLRPDPPAVVERFESPPERILQTRPLARLVDIEIGKLEAKLLKIEHTENG